MKTAASLVILLFVLTGCDSDRREAFKGLLAGSDQSTDKTGQSKEPAGQGDQHDQGVMTSGPIALDPSDVDCKFTENKGTTTFESHEGSMPKLIEASFDRIYVCENGVHIPSLDLYYLELVSDDRDGPPWAGSSASTDTNRYFLECYAAFRVVSDFNESSEIEADEFACVHRIYQQEAPYDRSKAARRTGHYAYKSKIANAKIIKAPTDESSEFHFSLIATVQNPLDSFSVNGEVFGFLGYRAENSLIPGN